MTEYLRKSTRTRKNLIQVVSSEVTTASFCFGQGRSEAECHVTVKRRLPTSWCQEAQRGGGRCLAQDIFFKDSSHVLVLLEKPYILITENNLWQPFFMIPPAGYWALNTGQVLYPNHNTQVCIMAMRKLSGTWSFKCNMLQFLQRIYLQNFSSKQVLWGGCGYLV